jgi:hypothetical protein
MMFAFRVLPILQRKRTTDQEWGDLMDLTVTASRKRPKAVWVISIFFLVSAVWTPLSFYLIYSGAVPVNDAQAAYLSHLSTIDYVIALATAAVNLAGAITLFLLRRPAPFLFIAAMAMGFIVTGWHVATKGWINAIGGAGLLGAVIGWAIGLWVCTYSWRLLKEGTLY